MGHALSDTVLEGGQGKVKDWGRLGVAGPIQGGERGSHTRPKQPSSVSEAPRSDTDEIWCI